MTTLIQDDRGAKLERLGAVLIRYSLVIVLLWVGSLKFTAYEAMGVHEHAINSPLLAWLANMMSVQSFAEVIGTIEIILAILIAIKPDAPKASYFGSVGAIIMFLLTLVYYTWCMATRLRFSVTFVCRPVSFEGCIIHKCSNIHRRRGIKSFLYHWAKL